jgi:hypothetical protein
MVAWPYWGSCRWISIRAFSSSEVLEVGGIEITECWVTVL